jgi:hypothetical protein
MLLAESIRGWSVMMWNRPGRRSWERLDRSFSHRLTDRQGVNEFMTLVGIGGQ